MSAACERIRREAAARPRSGLRHDDADGPQGTFASDDAIGFDPFPMLRCLQASGVNYAVFGQVAAILHGSTDLTGDLDVLWDGADDAVTDLAAVFEQVGVVLLDESGTAHADRGSALREPKCWFTAPGSSGDLCTPRLPWGSLDVRAFLTRRVWTEHNGLLVPYLDLPDLLSMRRAVNGPKHLRRLRELEQLGQGASSAAPSSGDGS